MPSRADSIPAQLVIVPVVQAQCLALHPNKPVLYVGRADRTSGHNLVTFEIGEDGSLIAGSRKEHADGVVAKPPPVVLGSEYAINSLAVNPTLPQIYLSVKPRNMVLFNKEPGNSSIVALSIDENGMPVHKIAGLSRPDTNLLVKWIGCELSGRFLFWNQSSAYLYGMHVDESGPNMQAPFMTNPPMRLHMWMFVPEWNRWFGIDTGLKRISFTLSPDGKKCENIQYFVTGRNSLDGLAVSLKYNKLYAPNSMSGMLHVEALNRGGGFTGLLRTWETAGVRYVAVDDAKNVLYAATYRSLFFVYHLDKDGYPSGTPERFDLGTGNLYDLAFSPRTGKVYAAVSKPPTTDP